MNIFISPHPDDAVLSCGGRILKERRKKQIVINVFSKPYDKPTMWDKICGNVNWPMETRIEEDKRILSGVDVKGIYLDFYDDAVYSDLKEIKRPNSEKELISKKIKDIICSYSKETDIFFPKGIDHIDHQLINRVGQKLSRDFTVYFYEDLPYSIDKKSGCNSYYEINKKIIDEKIKLMCKYKSQIKGFLKLTNTSSIEEFKSKVKKYHLNSGKFYEKICLKSN